MMANKPRLKSSFHYLFGLINIKPLIAYDTGVQLTDDHDAEHIPAYKCGLQGYVQMQ